jgi:hypothetical protein
MAQVQSPQSSSTGKGNSPFSELPSSVNQATPNGSPVGKGGGLQEAAKLQGSQGSVTFPSQDGQPQMGMPNAYSNTVGPMDQGFGGQQSSWDNSPKPMGGGKGSAGGSAGKGKGA